jgi:hypothetical protein
LQKLIASGEEKMTALKEEHAQEIHALNQKHKQEMLECNTEMNAILEQNREMKAISNNTAATSQDQQQQQHHRSSSSSCIIASIIASPEATSQEQQHHQSSSSSSITASPDQILINSCHANIKYCRENIPTATTLQNGNSSYMESTAVLLLIKAILERNRDTNALAINVEYAQVMQH